MIAQLGRGSHKDIVEYEYIDDGGLIGDEARIRARWAEVVPAGVTGMIIRSESERGLEIAAELNETEPRG